MTLSPELIRIYASGGPDDFFYECLSLSHPNFTATWHITNSVKPLNAVLEDGVTAVVFQPYPFAISLAGTGEDGNQDIEISISNVSRTPIDEIERAAEDPTQRIEFTYRVYIDTDTSKPATVIDGLSISQISITENRIITRASPSDLVNRVFPSRLYTITLFPGLVHV